MMLAVSIIVLSLCLFAFIFVCYLFAYDYVCEQLDHCNYFGEDYGKK